MVATHSKGKKLKDAIFGANQACQQAIKEHGANKVVNATIGTILDEEGKIATLPTVEEIYRTMKMSEVAAYTPIAGIPSYIKAVIDLTFAENRPKGFFGAVATAGGTGALYLAVTNYAERGESVLTSDWFWGNYNVICNEAGCKLETFELFDEAQKFNISSFKTEVERLLKHQKSLLIILNTPAHNPTGYSLGNDEWDEVLNILKDQAFKEKEISLLIDIAYIDYAGDTNSTRTFLKKLSSLPQNIFTLIAFSMSKSYTFYGQRTGALIGFSTDKNVIEEFKEVNKYSCRATWSNINGSAQSLLVKLNSDRKLIECYQAERNNLYEMVKRRAELFVKESKACGLNLLPYKDGFFIVVPTKNPEEVCDRLHKDLIFAIPLRKGIRIAACSISLEKMHGIAEKFLQALKSS